MSCQRTDVYHVAPEGLGWRLDITDPKTRHHVDCHISAAQIAYMAEQDKRRTESEDE